MSKFLKIQCACIFAAVFAFSTTVRAETITDVAGRTVEIPKKVERVLLGEGRMIDQLDGLDSYLAMFRDLIGATAGIRRAGAASLDLAYVAAGRYDAFWESGLSQWDMAAGALLIQEAGGLISDFKGGHDFLENGQVVTGNPKCFKAVLQTIQPHLPKK